jgi:hypothetical protein
MARVGTAANSDAFALRISAAWEDTMTHTAYRPMTALVIMIVTAQVSRAACPQHTFDPCPEPQAGYSLEVDRKSGRTWIKEARAVTTDTSTLGRLSAAAKKVPTGALPKAEATDKSDAVTDKVPAAEAAPRPVRAAEWRTQVRRYRGPRSLK